MVIQEKLERFGTRKILHALQRTWAGDLEQPVMMTDSTTMGIITFETRSTPSYACKDDGEGEKMVKMTAIFPPKRRWKNEGRESSCLRPAHCRGR